MVNIWLETWEVSAQDISKVIQEVHGLNENNEQQKYDPKVYLYNDIKEIAVFVQLHLRARRRDEYRQVS